jgi:ABC-type multidrug transport system fused ATPase/permease subunit
LGTGHLWSAHVGGEAPSPTDPVAAAAARAGIVELIDRLPQRWETPLDKTMPGGADLSGGEWQRVALARALRAVAAGAGVLVLDEPAAALDVESEARLVSGYLELAREVTSLVISHRFSVVRPVPKI